MFLPSGIRSVRDQPFVTYAFLAVAIALQLAVWIYPAVRPSEENETRRHLGAVTQLGIYRKTEVDKPAKLIPQLLGPFDLWEGELWRIPVSGFHHVNLWHPYNPLHLILNCLAIAFMGHILEFRMGRWQFAAFFLAAVIVSSVPELLMLNYGMGLSGGAYALFGLLLVMIQREESIADRLPPTFISTGFAWLFLCMVLTYFDALHVANAAHVAGLIYGWLCGQACYAQRSRGDQLRAAFLACHLLLVPAGYFLMNPLWMGTYHWYQAEYDPNEESKISHLEQAVVLDPSLRRPWTMLAQLYMRQGDTHRAWQTILKGMDYNRSDEEGVKLAQSLWRRFQTADDRWRALQHLGSVFDKEDRDWWVRLGIMPKSNKPIGFPVAFEFGYPKLELHQSQFEGELEIRRLLLKTDVENRDLAAPQVEPTRPDSATEGVTL